MPEVCPCGRCETMTASMGEMFRPYATARDATRLYYEEAGRWPPRDPASLPATG